MQSLSYLCHQTAMSCPNIKMTFKRRRSRLGNEELEDGLMDTVNGHEGRS